MNEADILKWLAGANISLPGIEKVNDDRILYLLGIDEDQLVSLISTHRLVMRFLARLKQSHPGWCSKTLHSRILHLSEVTRQRLKLQLEAMHEIRQALTGTNQPIIIVKGCSPYALTGDPCHIRASYDIDVLCEDPEILVKTLLNLGYVCKRHSESDHELATMSRDEITVEIHRHFPVWSYPPQVVPGDLIPTQNSDHWTQALTNRIQSVMQFTDLLEHVCYGVTSDTSNMAITDPCMCVFLLCTHAFRHFLEPPARRPIAVQLGVLASIYELSQLHQFDMSQFRGLVQRFNGYDSVHFIGSLLDLYLGRNPFASLLSQLGPLGDRSYKHDGRYLPFPRSLTLFGSWACLNLADELLFPFNMEAVNQALVANTITAGRDSAPIHYTVFCSDTENNISRTIVQTRAHERIPVEFYVIWGKEALSFEVVIREPLQEVHTYCLEIQDGPIKWQGTQLGQWPDGDGCGHVSMTESGCRFHVSFPWEVVWSRSPPRTRKSFLMTIARWPAAVDIWAEIIEIADPVIAIPLNIVLESRG